MSTLDTVEGVDFDVSHNEGTDSYRCGEHNKFQWAVSPDGSLFIYEKVTDNLFGIATKDARVKAYAANFWRCVDTTEEVVISDEEAEATLESCKA